MAQVEFGFNVTGTGWFLLMGQETHDPSLGGSEVHFLQGGGHSLIGTPMQDTDIMAIFVYQNGHLLKGSVLQNYCNTGCFLMQQQLNFFTNGFCCTFACNKRGVLNYR